MEKTLNEKMYQGCYGSKETPAAIQNWVKRNIVANIRRSESGQPRSTLCIWGPAGCSKTSIVKQLSGQTVDFRGKKEAIEVIDIPLAQIEEMGDILGYPVEEMKIRRWNGERPADASSEYKWIKAVDSVIRSYLKDGWELTDDKRTTYAPPSWAPKEARPGVILFDDGNRASQRIMRGLMQLVQDYRTISWNIPSGWTICFTGNPDNTLNQVTSMDTAQLTRMKHVTLEADAKEWAQWATDNGIDQRGVNFILRYPEMMIGKKRTNPRSLTEFFNCLPDYPDLTDPAQFKTCEMDAHASLDDETVTPLMTFLVRDCLLVVSPEMILDDPVTAKKKFAELMGGEMPRIDIAAVMMDRLCTYLFSKGYEYKAGHPAAFQQFMLNENLPKDLMFSALKRLSEREWGHRQDFLRPDIPDTGKKLLAVLLDINKR